MKARIASSIVGLALVAIAGVDCSRPGAKAETAAGGVATDAAGSQSGANDHDEVGVVQPAAEPKFSEKDTVDRNAVSAAMRRLPPSAFEELPDAVQAELETRDCTVPQSPLTPRHNVIRGRFIGPGDTDWAVICSRNGVSSILVLNDAGLLLSELRSSEDADWNQGGIRVYYSRLIAVADPAYILGQYEQYGGAKPPPLDHDGINDAFIEKGSEVHYFYRGEWLMLTGAD